MEIELAKLFGLPAHALLVHIPVVLVPLAAGGALVMAMSPRRRQAFGWLVVALIAVGFLGAWLAIGSGEELEDAVDKSELVDDHAEAGEQVLPVTGAFLVATGALMMVERARRRHHDDDAPHDAGRLRIAVAVLAVLSAASGVGATAVVIRAGHSGAKAVWDDEKVLEELSD